MQITYWYNSGFSVRTDRHLLLFDYVGGGLSEPIPADRAIAFVSHAHGDHFIPIVETWRKNRLLALVTGDDVKSGGQKMRPGDTLSADGVEIEAFGSTDEGVSFLVHTDGKTLYHAGDFNFWHWRGESTGAEVEEAEENFLRILSDLRGRAIDIAFFPVDPRMGAGYDEGARRFVGAVAPKVLIPMHFREDVWAARDFAAYLLGAQSKTSVKALTTPGESFTL